MPKKSSSQPEVSPLGCLVADATVWLVLIVLFTAFRGLLLAVFHAQLSPNTPTHSFVRCFGTGFHYDIQIATYALFPSLLLTLTAFVRSLGNWHGRVRTATLIFTLTACASAFVTDLLYFHEYQDQFNHWIFGLIYDDRQAIFQTIWKSYPIVWLTLGMLITIGIGVWTVKKLSDAVSARIVIPKNSYKGPLKLAVSTLIIGFMVMGARGSFGRRPMQLKDAATTGDAFLNKLVLNPFAALRYAIQQHRRLQTATGLQTFLPDGNIVAAAHALFPQAGQSLNLDEYLTCIAPGSATKPKHIFLIVMESYDSWPMQPQFAELGLTKSLTRLGQDGIQAKAFLSATDGTMGSLTALISGLPEAGVNANYQPSIRTGLPTSVAAIFERLGYRPRFFYGGYLSWQRLGEFCREQGFDEVFGGDQMSAQLTGNEWGVDDEVMFRFVLEHTGDEPTFNMIMSTSYHPPFSVDLKSKGFPEEALAQTKIGQQISRERLHIYGHLWYADRCLGAFVEACEGKLESPLFAITGDHFSRRFPPDLRPTLYERKAVPFVLYGKKVLEHNKPDVMAGSHLDIAPTLVNLTAPKGFLYHSFGRDMLDFSKPQVGFGVGAVVSPNFIFEIGNASRPEDLSGHPQVLNSAEALELSYRQRQALGWWRVMRGLVLPSHAPSSNALVK
jgi:phosphoglycerol transferase MdoB-like AlkP superfamily enzyme